MGSRETSHYPKYILIIINMFAIKCFKQMSKARKIVSSIIAQPQLSDTGLWSYYRLASSEVNLPLIHN